MLQKNYYLNIKKYLKSLCKDSVIELANNVGLNDYETLLLLNLNRNQSRVSTSIELGICESKYSKDMKQILIKIYDYLKRKSYFDETK